MTLPVKEIIPREIPADIIPTLNAFSDLLNEFVNFGSHVIDWDKSPVTNGPENIAPTMLFRHFLDLIDSISILSRNSCGDTSKLLVRGALETFFGIQYLFDGNTHDKAMAFLYVETLNEIKTLKKMNSATPEGQAFKKILDDEKMLSGYSINPAIILHKAIQDKEKVLLLPEFSNAHNEFLQLKSNKVKNPIWYRFFNGPQNIRELAIHLRQQTMYELLYRKWSGAVHGSDIFLGKVTSDQAGGVEIVQLRYIKDVQEIVKYSLSLCIKVFQVYIDNRIPTRKSDFVNWYATIRDQYLLFNTKELIQVL
ncbi:DUF5677 domain-containing protein [Terrimonas ferruginea]|uniref:DUF5677 domain-containing protein n=1 Tax=Terrimonas ferruginea TaxID=249 RepID=UPI000416CF9B|nr:DUF5677 domain-containing protein [Terrimonas ferruginea]